MCMGRELREGAEWPWDVTTSHCDCIHLSSAVLAILLRCCSDIRRNDLSGSVLKFALKHPPDISTFFSCSFGQSFHAEPIRAFPPHGHSKAHISPLTYSPTAADSSLSFRTHTLLPPSFFWNRWSLLSWPAPPSPPHLLLSSSHLALHWLQTQEAFMEELRSKAFTQTAGLLWPFPKSPL